MSARLCIALVGFGLIAQANRAGADQAEQRFLDGLLQRHLFSLAEATCRVRLADPAISPRQRAETTVDLSRTYAERALNSPPAERSAWWKKAQESVTRYEQETARGTDVDFLVQRQSAIVHLARGELARHEADVVANPDRLHDQARRDLRQAVTRLKALRDKIQQTLATRSGTANDGHHLPGNALRHLINRIDYDLARALRNQALCYEAGTADRIHAVQRALESLEMLTARSDPIDWKSRLERLACLRLAGNPVAFDRYMHNLNEAAPPEDIAARIVLEQAREQLDRGDTKGALVALQPRLPFAPAADAERDFIRLQSFLAAWRTEKDAAIARQWQRQAAEQVERIEQRHGAYWMRRAEGVMAHHVTSDSPTEDLALLTRAATGLCRAGKWADAVRAYDQARAKAKAKGLRREAFDLGFAAAGIQQQQSHFAEAQARYRQVAATFPNLPEAPNAHLLAAFNAAQAMRHDKTGNGTLGIEDYVRLLKEHLVQFPKASTSDQARWWLARVMLARQQWQSAIEVLTDVSAGSDPFLAALDGIAQAYRQRIAQAELSSKRRAALAEEAATYFSQVAADLAESKTGPRSALAAAATGAAAFHLQRTPLDSRTLAMVEQLLATALAPTSEARPANRTAAGLLRVQWLALQPNATEQAIAAYDENTEAPVADRLDLLKRLRAFKMQGTPKQQCKIASLILHVGADLTRSSESLDATAQLERDQTLIEAHATVGHDAEARRLSRAIAKEHPNRGDLQAQYARLLLESNDRTSWQAALMKWRAVEKRSRPGTDRWFDAKYSQALAHHRLGNDEQAVRILTLTQILHPDWGNAETKARVLKLLRQCQPQDP